jgi:hypothetical protein
MWNVIIVPTVWYYCRGQLNTTLSEQKEHSTLWRTVKIPQCRNSENIPHCREQLKYHTVADNVEYSYFSDSVVF